MKNKIYFIRITHYRNDIVEVDFVPQGDGSIHRYKSPSNDSLYRLLNNSMISDVNPLREHDRFAMEIFPDYSV